ncbi:MAG: Ldh family oxidoreductase [Propionibacteriales bacterium]|nr:Ldh family oxidoreductase [Propionibacteriales bacterium]
MSGSATGPVLVDADGLRRFARGVLETAGLDGESAALSSDVLVRTTMRGVESHGIWFLDRYVRQLREGGANRAARVRPVADHGGLLVLDGDAGLGLAVASRATRTAIERAGAHGLAVVSVRNANHFGAAGHYALMCAEAGYLGLVTSNTPPIMAVTGSRSRVIGNNPLAFGVPRTAAPPVVLDIAMSRVAGGKVRMAIERGDQVPLGWILDPDGNPTTDPEDFFVRRGALLPMEDHKGYGLALMVEALSAGLSGAAMTSAVGNWLHTPDTPSDTGFFLMVIDVRTGGPFDAFQDRMRSLCEEIAGAPRAPSVDRIVMPGDLEHEREVVALAHGVPLRGEIWSTLGELAETLGLEDELASIRR